MMQPSFTATGAGNTPVPPFARPWPAPEHVRTRANPYHNAWTESFIATRKHEILQGGCFETFTDAKTELFNYIEAYYNTHRKHSALGYLSLSRFEASLQPSTKKPTGPKIGCTSETQIQRRTDYSSVTRGRRARAPSKACARS